MAENRDKIREKNLIPFKKGESGNPDGRPLGQKNYSTLYKEALLKLATLNNKQPDEIEMELISKGIMSARNGDYRFYKDILDRLFGTAIQRTIDESEKPKIQSTYNFIFSPEVQADVKEIESRIKAKLTQKHEYPQEN